VMASRKIRASVVETTLEAGTRSGLTLGEEDGAATAIGEPDASKMAAEIARYVLTPMKACLFSNGC